MFHTGKTAWEANVKYLPTIEKLRLHDTAHQLTSFSFSKASYLSWRFLYSNCHSSAFIASAMCLVWSSWAYKSESIRTVSVGMFPLYKLAGIWNCAEASLHSAAFRLPVSCRCPVDCGQRWPCGAPPPARKCVACTQCCALPGGALVCASHQDPPTSSCTSPLVIQAGSPGLTSAWGAGEDSMGGAEYQERDMTFTQYICLDVYLTTENQQLWRKQCHA